MTIHYTTSMASSWESPSPTDDTDDQRQMLILYTLTPILCLGIIAIIIGIILIPLIIRNNKRKMLHNTSNLDNR